MQRSTGRTKHSSTTGRLQCNMRFICGTLCRKETCASHRMRSSPSHSFVHHRICSVPEYGAAQPTFLSQRCKTVRNYQNGHHGQGEVSFFFFFLTSAVWPLFRLVIAIFFPNCLLMVTLICNFRTSRGSFDPKSLVSARCQC